MSVDLDPDAALMLRVKQGDWAAFTELVDKYKQPVMNLVCRMLHDAAEAHVLGEKGGIGKILLLMPDSSD